MGDWPKDKLLRHGAELPMAERIRRYQHNIRTIREAGCTVPTSAMIDSLDPAKSSGLPMARFEAIDSRMQSRSSHPKSTMATMHRPGRLSVSSA